MSLPPSQRASSERRVTLVTEGGTPLGTASDPLVTSGGGGAIIEVDYTDASPLTITLGGVSQQVFAANPDRTGLIIQNVSDDPLWVDFDVAAVLAPPSLLLIGGGLGILEFPDPTGRIEKGAINIIGATTGQAFSAKEAEDV